MLDFGVFSTADPGDCPYASRIVLVSSKDGGFKMCLDYRQLKHQTGNDQYPLPRIDEIFTDLPDAHCFVSLDLLIGYHHIPCRVEHMPKTAFITQKGLFVFNVMPFGLCNAP